MLRGLYIPMNSLNVQQAKVNTVSNNLANADTAGYKKNDIEVGNFPQAFKLALERGSNARREPIGYANLGTMVAREVIVNTQGLLTDTGVNTDFGLQGQGFFTLESPDGKEFYSRDGAFHLDQEGYLLNSDGYYVLGEGGPIVINEPENFYVKEDGTIIEGRGEDAQEVDKLRLLEFADTSLLEKTDGNYFTDLDNIGTEAEDTRVSQGRLEKSNVDMVKEISSMIATARIYESSHKLIQTSDELLDKSINQVGRIR